MQTILMIGCGAISQAAVRYLEPNQAIRIGAALIEPGTEAQARDLFGEDAAIGHNIDEIDMAVDLAVDCAGHPALRQHGAAILSRGTDLITVSSGALGDPELFDELATAARARSSARSSDSPFRASW